MVQYPASKSSTPPSSSSGDSPWDEEVAEVEVKKPMIVGSFDGSQKTDATEAKPVPFNVPSDVVKEKEKEKIPAASVVRLEPATPLKSDPAPKPPVESVARFEPIASPRADSASKPPVQSVPVNPPKAEAGVTELLKNKNDGPQQTVAGPTIIHAPRVGGEVSSRGQAQKQVQPAPSSPAPLPIQQVSTKNQLPAKQQSLFSKLFKKKSPKTNQAPVATANNTRSVPRPDSPKSRTLLIVGGVILLFVAGVFLTEAGIAGFGLEKIYGSVGLEKIWGGLSKNPEQALALSVSNFKTNQDFKVSGTISVSASKSSNSSILGPLLTFAGPAILRSDINIAESGKAVLSVESDPYSTDSSGYDYYGNSSSDTGTTTQDDIVGSDTVVDDPAASDLFSDDSTSSSIPQDSDESFQYETTAIKEINSEIQTISSRDGISSEISIKKIVGTEDNISIISSGSDLYLKTNEKIKYSDSYKVNSWLNYQLPNFKNDNIFSDLANVKPDSGFSVDGKRVSNEKVGDVRCYRYNFSNLEIGDSLSGIGLKKEMIQNISGDVWIGIADKLMRKIDITITPTTASSVTKIRISLNFTDYGITNSIEIPSESSTIQVTGDSLATEDVVADTLLTDSSRDTLRRTDLSALKKALEAYKASTGRYPISSTLDRSSSEASILKASLVPTYLAELPKDPKVSEGWFYGYKSSDGISFTLSARIENESDQQSSVVDGLRLYYLKND